MHALFSGVGVKFYQEQVPLFSQNNATSKQKSKKKLAVSRQKPSQKAHLKARKRSKNDHKPSHSQYCKKFLAVANSMLGVTFEFKSAVYGKWIPRTGKPLLTCFTKDETRIEIQPTRPIIMKVPD